MNKSMLNAEKRAFSLAEALITLLIVCLITLASIPILTKKKRSASDIAKHGSFACYWDGDELVSKYQIGGIITTGNTFVDSNELDQRLAFSSGHLQYISQSRKGCVFSPPPGTKNFVITVVGGGGGGAGGYAKDFIQSFFQNESGSVTAGDKNEDDSIDNKNDPEDDEDDEMGEAEDVYVVSPSGTSVMFTAPVTTKYQFLVAAGGGGGGDIYGGCRDGGSYTKSWPCAGSGTPGAVLVTSALEFPKDTQFKITPGSYGAMGGKKVVGSPGGDSILTATANGKEYFLLAQGGGGGFSPNYEGKNKCYYYENSYCAPLGPRTCYEQYKKYAGDSDLRKRDAKSHKCSSKSTARNLGSSGSSGGYLNRGFDLQVKGIYDKAIEWYEYEKIGAYLYTVGANGGWIKGTDAKRYDRPEHRPYRNSKMTKSLMDSFDISQFEDQAHPFASGGSGGVSGGSGDKSPTSGGRGVVAVKYHRAFGGLGGKAGSVLQMAYSDLPQNTLLFPGRGGMGGGLYILELKSGSKSHYVLQTVPATSGQSSYIKNGTEALGGEGAQSVNPDYPATYYLINDDNTNIGQNGQMSNILPVQKSAGGAGGRSSVAQNTYINNTNQLHGLTRTDIFKNGKIVGLFNEIVAAGAGGGGGASAVAFSNSLPNENSYNAQKNYVDTNFGRGGDGSSGLVFIQW